MQGSINAKQNELILSEHLKFLKIYSNVLPRRAMWHTGVTDGHKIFLGEKNDLSFPYKARYLKVHSKVWDNFWTLKAL